MGFEKVICIKCGEVLECEVIRNNIEISARPIIVDNFCTTCGERGLSTKEYVEQDIKEIHK